MILTKAQLRSYSGIDRLTEARLETRYFSSYEANVRVFLSHKHTDKKELFAVKKILEDIGAKPYVDWMDKSLPSETSAETADEIKRKIRQSNKFVFIATDLALISPWCNWEIGYSDSLKYDSSSMALFAVSENDGTWKGNEYMRLYPVIEYENGTTKYSNGIIIPKGYYVEYPCDENNQRHIVPLKDWLLRR
ncbi:MAG: toll/interleukin-1 receptor domain-containing protein [Bacteroidaceae bacterium]|nr:toll/interleukin-1 receptor domain-containing protein [Bacteroidaceae bacterium]